MIVNYAFRIKFYLSQAGAISSDNPEEQFFISNGKTAKIFCYKNKLSESSEIYICTNGYSSVDEAKEEGKKIQKSILIASSLRRIFVDVGKDRATIIIPKELKEKLLNEYKVEFIEEVHGLDVYNASKNIKIVKGTQPTLVTVNKATDLIKDIQSLLSASISTYLNDKELLAFELYGASGFEKSPRSRFLTLMLAIESMIEQKDRPPKIINAIKYLIKIFETMNLNTDEIKSIKSGIFDLKIESISKSGQNLSKTLLGSKKYQGSDPSKFFKYCYKIRSNLVHNGEPNIPDHKFSGLAATLEIFVHDILESKIKLLANQSLRLTLNEKITDYSGSE